MGSCPHNTIPDTSVAFFIFQLFFEKIFQEGGWEEERGLSDLAGG